MFTKVFLLLCFFPFVIFAVDSDFDGVEDNVDACLETSMLDLVTADGCSESQKKKLKTSLFQSYSLFNIPNDESIQNYNVALLFSYESWLLYVGSGYFQYNNSLNDINDFTDTTVLVQKAFQLSSSHYLKTSLSTTLPTFDTEGNEVDYGTNVSYLYVNNHFDVELGYQYDLIKDANSENIQTGYLYVGYALTGALRTSLGYRQDSQERKSTTLSAQYLYTDKLNLSYGFSKGNNSFYDTFHSLGLGYSF